MFIDEVSIEVQAGDGGDGCVSFRREKYVSRGGPDGGDGGRGGDVILEVRSDLNTLLAVSRRRHYKAQNGRPGEGGLRTGRSGQDVVIGVPVGTVVRLPDTGDVVQELLEAGTRYVLAQGGKGGKGNKRFASSTRRVPRESTPGEVGESGVYLLELKLLADVGLVGLPNAGKSTLLSRISDARPRVAPYPFTTLEPSLGIVGLGEFRQIVVADIPGLIEGAHEGTGLGDEFLRHIERTNLLVHLVDLAPLADPGPVEAYQVIRHELEAYSPDLASKPELVVGNKMDLPEAEAGRVALSESLGRPVLGISAATGRGIPQLLAELARLVDPDRVAG